MISKKHPQIPIILLQQFSIALEFNLALKKKNKKHLDFWCHCDVWNSQILPLLMRIFILFHNVLWKVGNVFVWSSAPNTSRCITHRMAGAVDVIPSHQLFECHSPIVVAGYFFLLMETVLWGFLIFLHTCEQSIELPFVPFTGFCIASSLGSEGSFSLWNKGQAYFLAL